MGNFFGNIWRRLFGRLEEYKILIIGLNNAGKSTILELFKTGELHQPKPTIGYEYEELQFNNVNLKVWDLSGQENFRTVWKHYYVGVRGIVFVIDSSEADKIENARDELHKIMSEVELAGVPVCILANKQDIETALSFNEIQ